MNARLIVEVARGVLVGDAHRRSVLGEVPVRHAHNRVLLVNDHGNPHRSAARATGMET